MEGLPVTHPNRSFDLIAVALQALTSCRLQPCFPFLLMTGFHAEPVGSRDKCWDTHDQKFVSLEAADHCHTDCNSGNTWQRPQRNPQCVGVRAQLSQVNQGGTTSNVEDRDRSRTE